MSETEVSEIADTGGMGARIVSPGQAVRGDDHVYAPSKSTGSITTLPMTDDEMAAAAEREKTKTIGFRP